jgi:hypothetical protein
VVVTVAVVGVVANFPSKSAISEQPDIPVANVTEELAMKIKTKVRGGDRGCGGGPNPNPGGPIFI